MSEKEAIEALRLAQNNGDIEAAHVEADYVLICLLRSIGYDDVADEWSKVPRWYA